MYRVLIVEDEPVVRRGLENCIDWGEFGFAICGRAADGLEALELVKGNCPDLVITDVKMPNMDGIALSQKIREAYPKTEIVIISGYDEFAYAQSAIHIGVYEYLLKPTEKGNLENVLKGVYNRLKKKQEFDDNYSHMLRQAQEHLPVIKNQFFSDLASGKLLDLEELSGRASHFGGIPLLAPYYLACFEIDQSVGLKDFNVLRIFQRDIACRHISGICPYESFENMNKWYFIVGCEGDMFEEALEQACKAIIEDFASSTGFTMSAGISRQYSDWLDMPEACRDCGTALLARITDGPGLFSFCEQVAELPLGVPSLRHELFDRFCIHMRLFNETETCKILSEQFDYLLGIKASHAHFSSLAVLTLLELHNLAVTANAGKAILDSIDRELAKLHECKTAESLERNVSGIVKDTMDVLRNATKKNNRSIAAEATRYIQEHLGAEVTLQNVADHVHVSRNYLCKVFKRELNETFVNCLTRMRIAKAKELLRGSDMKIHEIAVLTGYEDYSYFTQVFKKNTGITATDYRKTYFGP
ncbi:MAG: response regulator [Clostridiales bacterium]|nr:response regulator [Clostridiales bacterium]